MNYNETCFYGIDFKKIKLYCKVNYVASIKTRELYRKQSSNDIFIDSEKFYQVIRVDFDNELLWVPCYCAKTDTYVPVVLNFNHVEFSYFFEETKEDELNELSF